MPAFRCYSWQTLGCFKKKVKVQKIYSSKRSNTFTYLIDPSHMKWFMVKSHTNDIRMTYETYEWHTDDIRVHTDDIQDIRVTYEWHKSTYEWYTDDIRVHTGDIRVYTSDIQMTYEYTQMTYEWHTSDIQMACGSTSK